jgi:hypothetical protein
MSRTKPNGRPGPEAARRSFASTNGYGLALELLIVTYVLAVTLSAQWGGR